MKLELYQVDTFTGKLFGGNPACVVPLTEWLPNEMLLKIAKENAVAETAFFIDKGYKIQLRWFTPEIEMDLCGHATLATAHCLHTILNYPQNILIFETLSGDLTVTIRNELYTLCLPARKPTMDSLPEIISKSLSIQPIEVLKSRDYVLVYENETQIKNLVIDRQTFDKINLDPGGIAVTALGNNCDFVSRYFTPQSTILEDPVTGSAHCSLIPFWAERLNKKSMLAYQLSDRIGKLICEDKGERITISGEAKTYFVGSLWTE
jgi:PhzF family phenazine biosynthesis protein